MEGAQPRDANDLLHGTLDLLVLKALSWEPMHGYGLSKWIEERTDDELEIADSALYKSLYRLEDAGAITSEWGVSENNRRAKYYSLTPPAGPPMPRPPLLSPAPPPRGAAIRASRRSLPRCRALVPGSPPTQR